MLKGIPPILSPGLLKVLHEMGHGDDLVFADGNFPAASIAGATPGGLLRADGHGIVALLEAVLKFFPLDTFVEHPAAVMAVVPGHNYTPIIWEEYRRVIGACGEPFHDFEYIERFAFYERARKAYAVVASGETALYANLILKKGVVTS
ncbi:MAG: RbsD/FucU family protein [Chloroflexota bacterium]